MTGLSSPQGVAYLDGDWYVTDTGNGLLMRVDPGALGGEVVLEGLSERDLADLYQYLKSL